MTTATPTKPAETAKKPADPKPPTGAAKPKVNRKVGVRRKPEERIAALQKAINEAHEAHAAKIEKMESKLNELKTQNAARLAALEALGSNKDAKAAHDALLEQERELRKQRAALRQVTGLKVAPAKGTRKKAK